jgi:prepilin-type processing-associated H-X9-DG protein
MNNTRQLGIAITMYASDFHKFTGSIKVPDFYYIWPLRLLPYMGNNRDAFWCPANDIKARWDTNYNTTLRFNSLTNIWATGSPNATMFSYGINDWGIGWVAPVGNPGLGLGGDIDPANGRIESEESIVLKPSDMIAMGDTATDRSWDGNMDPHESDQWPARRHNNKYTVLTFVDGHSESAVRNDVISPVNNYWRARWNNDNDPHTNTPAGFATWSTAGMDTKP